MPAISHPVSSRLGGGRAIVTGGSAGIGAAIVSRLSADGGVVHVIDIDSPRSDSSASSTTADIADEEAVRAAVSEALSAMGGVDVLINNVGIAGPTSPIEEVDIAELRRCLEVNIGGTALVTKHAVPHMGRGSSIVNIVSTAGTLGYPGRSAYAASKWAVVGLTKTWAMELGPRGIRVNAVAPGSVAGERMDRVIAAEAEATGRSADDIRQGYGVQTSMKTFVTADEIADMVAFLCGPSAAKVSGQVVAVDGNTETLRS